MKLSHASSHSQVWFDVFWGPEILIRLVFCVVDSQCMKNSVLQNLCGISSITFFYNYPSLICLFKLWRKYSDVLSKESDSRFWKANHTHINRQYVAVMFTLPFAAAALTLSNYAKLAANILIVGLGGGTMNIFLTNHFPKVAFAVIYRCFAKHSLFMYWSYCGFFSSLCWYLISAKI